jgi:2,3-bisphosphoglycerate-dependent phosphoglycerate mutase
MAKQLYIIRHCQAAGQEPDARLTDEGLEQAEALADRLAETGIQRVVTSPFLRAVQSAEPLADRLGLAIRPDQRLAERVLCAEPRPDWREQLAQTFTDLDLCLEGGESSREAMARGAEAIADILEFPVDTTAVVSHGNLVTLLLKHFDDRFGFAQWQELSNPDVFLVKVGQATDPVSRVWR